MLQVHKPTGFPVTVLNATVPADVPFVVRVRDIFIYVPACQIPFNKFLYKHK